MTTKSIIYIYFKSFFKMSVLWCMNGDASVFQYNCAAECAEK
jgi:hypothetical protein